LLIPEIWENGQLLIFSLLFEKFIIKDRPQRIILGFADHHTPTTPTFAHDPHNYDMTCDTHSAVMHVEKPALAKRHARTNRSTKFFKPLTHWRMFAPLT
jgi:hypothetical protein